MGDTASAESNLNTSHLGQGWRRSTHSMSNGQCIETARFPSGGIGVRDSKSPTGSILHFEPYAWAAFVAGLRGA
jgi:Domain of unknown function (DUF397)